MEYVRVMTKMANRTFHGSVVIELPPQGSSGPFVAEPLDFDVPIHDAKLQAVDE
jgi:hypothetical protein